MKTLQVKETANNEGNERENIHLGGRSRGRGEFRSFHGGSDNRDRWRNDGQMQFNEQSNMRKVLQIAEGMGTQKLIVCIEINK